MEVLLRRHGGDGGATAVLVRCHGGHGGATAIPLRIGPIGGGFEHVQSILRATAKVRGFDSCPRCYCDHWRSLAEPLRNHGDHGGATEGYAVQAP